MTYASATDISPNGQLITGFSSTDDGGYGVRWDRASGSWQPTAIPVGSALAVSDDGTVVGSIPVAGSQTERRARVWSEAGSVELPGIDTRANGISADGTVVVGYRLQDASCRRPPCGKYEIPMAWTLVNGEWVAQELVALEGVDGEASAVAMVSGETVIVGYGFTKKDAIRRAVYWKADAQSSFGAPVRLGGLADEPKAFARATDVNASGQVVGYSGVLTMSPRKTIPPVAVMWQLP